MTTEQLVMLITAAGGPEVFQQRRVSIPTPADDELLIAVEAAGINRHDCNQRRRGATPAHSDIPGLEVAGRVVGIGSRVSGWTSGQPVCALVDGDGYAEYAVAKAAQALPLPTGLSVRDAAALPEALFTIWHNFFNVAALGPGESVLLHGGTSGVGSMAIQLLSALGHPVLATCGSADKVSIAVELGATAAFNYRSDDFVAGVGHATGGRGVDVILDMSGGRYSVQNVKALARRGRLVHLSPGDGAEFGVPLRELMVKEAKVSGSMLRPLPDEEKALIAKRLHAVAWPLLSAGRIKPLIHRAMPLADAASAHSMMEQGDHAGKIVLECSKDGRE